VLAFAVTAGAIVWILCALTGSIAAGIAAAAVFVLNPNVVYLQSTPMTEPLLLATTTVAVAMLIAWVRSAHDGRIGTAAIGIAFALACLTRYEAWPVTLSALAAAFVSRSRVNRSSEAALRDLGGIALYPAAAIFGFAIFSRVVVGRWFVSGDFFVPENKALGDWWLAAKEIGWGTRELSGAVLVWIGGAGVAVAVARSTIGLRRRNSSAAFALPVMLMAMAAIPWAAFYRGHPFRIRYMVPLIAVEAIGVGIAAAAIPGRRIRALAAAALVAVAMYELRPLDGAAPMVVEAQWDRPNLPARARVTACIGQLAPGAKIMASMGSLGHYMQEASEAGLSIRDFLHEGNGDIWLAALERPQPFADWLLIEEKAEGGDMLARLAREKPAFLAGYERVCEGAGMALYRRGASAMTAGDTEAFASHGEHRKP
jgi:hypothetical protein